MYSKEQVHGFKTIFTYDPEFDLKPIIIRRQLVWQTMIEWHDPMNWQPDHRLPCGRDRVALPENYLLFLNYPLDTIELVLPQNGELILGPNGNIRLITEDGGNDDFNGQQNKCPSSPETKGSNLEFHPFQDRPTSWFSPINWQVVYQTPDPSDYIPVSQMEWSSSTLFSSSWFSPISTYATFISTSRPGSISIVPHSERIPCTNDWVHFPVTNGTFKVTIERSSQIPLLSQLSIGTTRFTSRAKFAEFAQSFRGEMLFDIRDYNHLSFVSSSNNQLGHTLYCGNDAPKKLKLICQNLETSCPLVHQLRCSDPIIPEGHCCPICASTLVLRRRKNVAVTKLTDLIVYRLIFGHLRAIHAQEPLLASGVRLYGHWLYNGRLQVIVDNLHLPSDNDDEQSMMFNDKFIKSLNEWINKNR